MVSASKVSATAITRAQQRNLVALQAIRIAAAVQRFVVQFDAGKHFCNCVTGRRMLAPLVVCVFMISNSSGVSAPGFFRMWSSMPILPTSCSWAEMRRISMKSVVQLHLARDQQGVARDAVGVAASVGIFFVDRAGQHLDGAHEQRAVLFGGALQVFDELLEFFRHGVEGVRQFADFGAAVQRARAARNLPRRSRGWTGSARPADS